MQYAYEELSPEQFEGLIVLLCQKLLGISVKGFATGPDGGRDAKFNGTAELHPSRTAPWVGMTIIQAKHTNGCNRSFSETDFFNPPSVSTIIGLEAPKIKELRDAGELDHYMLFSNRRLSAGTDQAIQSHLSTFCNVPISSIYLCGLEQLEMLLRTFKDVPKRANLDPIDSPLIVSSEDLAEVVEAFARHKTDVQALLDDPPTPRVSYDEKNRVNAMTDEYAKALRKRFMKDTYQIQTFLSSPENVKLLRLYESVVDEFQLKIIAKRKDYQSFDSVMNYLFDLLFARDPVLRQRKHKRLTRAMVFYMYWNCDIGDTGETADDSSAH